MRKTSALLKTALAFVLALGVVGGLTACKGNTDADKKEISTVISKTYDDAMAFDETIVNEILAEAQFEDMSELGVDGKDILAAVFKNFKYNIVDVNVNGDKAIATVHVSNIDLTVALSKFQDAFIQWAQTEEGMKAFMGEDASAIGAGVKSALDTGFGDSSLETKEGDVTINMVKKDGKWEPVNRVELYDSMVIGFEG
ncbi:hypothetical protein [Atopobium fossor]|uniref:hypothetical protein n=1 Tax=Atopobium fossor TaxID=39487 RepID=UPI0004069C90|nr:hypothetical protein [Atopobium fossor]